MNIDGIWNLSGDVKEGEIISLISAASETFRPQYEIYFKINSVRKREDKRLELQGIAFYGTSAERPAVLVLNADYVDTSPHLEANFNSVGELTL